MYSSIRVLRNLMTLATQFPGAGLASHTRTTSAWATDSSLLGMAAVVTAAEFCRVGGALVIEEQASTSWGNKRSLSRVSRGTKGTRVTPPPRRLDLVVVTRRDCSRHIRSIHGGPSTHCRRLQRCVTLGRTTGRPLRLFERLFVLLLSILNLHDWSRLCIPSFHFAHCLGSGRRLASQPGSPNARPPFEKNGSKPWS